MGGLGGFFGGGVDLRVGGGILFDCSAAVPEPWSTRRPARIQPLGFASHKLDGWRPAHRDAAAGAAPPPQAHRGR
jgi:hypothetical protein